MPQSTDLARKRQEALHELLETERTYVQRLTTTFKVYVRGSSKMLIDDERASLFSNLEDILLANDTFLRELEQRFKEKNECDIGDLFLKHIPNFSVYMVYCRNQHSSIQFLKDKMKVTEFLKFMQDSLSNPECAGLDLASFLLEPVQRLTRYPMLLKQIQKYTEPNSDEYKFLDLALEESEGLLHRVNISMKEGEEQHKLQQLQRRLSTHSRLSSIGFDQTNSPTKLPVNLAGLTRTFSERKLLKSGIWIKLKSRRKLIVFLFSDFLLMTEAASGDTGIEALNDDGGKLKIYRTPIHLDHIWLMKEVESSKVPESWRNSTEFRSLEIEAHDLAPLDVHIEAGEYEAWLDAIATAKRRLKVSAQPVERNNVETSIGTLKLSILSASHLHVDSSYYCQIQTRDASFRCSTQPAKAPNPVWNQAFAIPLKEGTECVEIELFKYCQFDINDSIGRANLSLDFLQDNEMLSLGSTILELEPSSVQLMVDVSFVPKK